MIKFEPAQTLKRLRSRYRLVIMNEDTYEEVLKFGLSRLSVYIGLSSLFVLFSVFTVVIIIFTPIKYYLPGVGYGDVKQMREYKYLKIRTDSMENALRQKQQYFDDLHAVLQGKIIPLDTTKLELPKVENEED